MTEPRECSFPGCDRLSRSEYCKRHKPQREIPGYRDMYCRLCEFGPRCSLAAHINEKHGGITEYKRLFGWDSVMSADMRRNFRAQWDDRLEDGIVTNEINPKSKRTCRRGHLLTESNVYYVRHGGNGPNRDDLKRRCRKCRRALWAKKRKVAAWRNRYRSCHWCGKKYLPVSKHQKYCSMKHRVDAGRKRNEDTIKTYNREYMRAKRAAQRKSPAPQ